MASTLSDSFRSQPRTLAANLTVVYLWWLLTTPYLSNRLSFLATIRFERILVGSLLIALLLGGHIYSRHAPLSRLLLTFLLVTMTSHVFSAYSHLPLAQQWLNQYWKYVVMYFLVLYSVRSTGDLRRIVCGVIVIYASYEIYSWLDFLRGGSYVYQQGMRRMVGVWSGGGVGAANGWGMTCAFMVPLGVAWRSCTTSNMTRRFCEFFVFLSVLSVVFSGTRAAVVVLALYAAGAHFRLILNSKWLTLALVTIGLTWTTLPQEYRHRYGALIFVDKEADLSDTDSVAVHSAEGRLQGLVDGWRLFQEKPVFGFGPGSSSYARQNLPNYIPTDDGAPLQLHNLYGQLLAETGLIGSVLFVAILATYFQQLRKICLDGTSDPRVLTWHFGLQRSLTHLGAMLVVYGMASHTLFKFHWLIAFSLQAALVYVNRSEFITNTDHVTRWSEPAVDTYCENATV